ncbi:hypothetical protein [Leuconostoc mesenteroides]|uniref:hypothetical protein n=1 Tax=Leuconostoc mesenteroides TaxID=1245 RepID=UPI0023600536|nr:hypothetical protein [Leuconostoc mesenteroides]
MFNWGFIVQVVGVLCLIWLIAVIKKIPDAVSDKIKDERNFAHTKQLQIDNFFRQNSGSEMQRVLFSWVEILSDETKIGELSENGGLKKLINETVGYSSPNTIKLMGMFFQNLYTNNVEKEGQDSDMSTLVYVAMIASSLKYDFSGEEIDSFDLLRIQFNDYVIHEQEMLEHQKNICEALKN